MSAPQNQPVADANDGDPVASTIPGYSSNPQADSDDTATQSTIPGYSSNPQADDDDAATQSTVPGYSSHPGGAEGSV